MAAIAFRQSLQRGGTGGRLLRSIPSSNAAAGGLFLNDWCLSALVGEANSRERYCSSNALSWTKRQTQTHEDLRCAKTRAFSTVAEHARSNQAIPHPHMGGQAIRGATGSKSSSSEEEEEEWWDPATVTQNLREASSSRNNKQKHKQKHNLQRAVASYERHLRHLINTNNPPNKDSHLLASPETAQNAVQILLQMKLSRPDRRKRIRRLEKLLGQTPDLQLTDDLSYLLLQANGQAGNVGRSLEILHLRTRRNYPPRGTVEFDLVVQAILAAGAELRQFRNPYARDSEQSTIDDPTRFLDAILRNMKLRGVALDNWMAVRMLSTYASTGRSGRAVHFFYKLHKVKSNSGDKDTRSRRGRLWMQYRSPPPRQKIPSMQRAATPNNSNNSTNHTTTSPSPPTPWEARLAKETNRNWSAPLTAAFDFAESLTRGTAHGHPPVQLGLVGWNTMLKICCHRGALHRALHLLQVVMPEELGLRADVYSYNTVMHGLARVGDTTYLKDLLIQMTNTNVALDKHTMQALILGHLNTGDVGGAITVVQDVFNQHGVLPPASSHLDILEFALVNGLVYEAKRHVYFLQQLWKWEDGRRTEEDEDEEGDKIVGMWLDEGNAQLGKEALMRLFEYHGEELKEEDFF